MSLRYTYESAYRPDGTEKPGKNRLTWEDNDSPNPADWTLIIKEYSPVGKALQAIREASPDEIEEIKRILGIQ